MSEPKHTGSSPQTPRAPLSEAVKTQRARRERQHREGQGSLAQNLSLVGVLGWTIVLPTLAGIFAGRWLDARFGTGVFWTLGLLTLGLALGCVLAWRRMHSP